MANINFRDLFPFDESGSTNPAPGGLPGLLRQVAPQWRAPPSLLGADPASLLQQPGRELDAQQWRALAGQGQLVRPLSSNPADAEAASPRDPNFRQLISRPQGAAQRITGGESLGTSDASTRVALNVPPAGLARRVTESADLRSPENDAGAAKLMRVGGYSSPFPGGRLPLAPSFWPQPRDEDLAKMWKAITGAWERLREWRASPEARVWPAERLPEWLGTVLESRIRKPKTSRPIRDISDLKDRDITSEKFSEFPVCNRQYISEANECAGRADDGVKPDYVRACFERALKRMNNCEKNDGMPDLMNGPAKWSDRDEEESFTPTRLDPDQPPDRRSLMDPAFEQRPGSRRSVDDPYIDPSGPYQRMNRARGAKPKGR